MELLFGDAPVGRSSNRSKRNKENITKAKVLW